MSVCPHVIHNDLESPAAAHENGGILAACIDARRRQCAQREPIDMADDAVNLDSRSGHIRSVAQYLCARRTGARGIGTHVHDA
jgi:hypothetical protein